MIKVKNLLTLIVLQEFFPFLDWKRHVFVDLVIAKNGMNYVSHYQKPNFNHDFNACIPALSLDLFSPVINWHDYKKSLRVRIGKLFIIFLSCHLHSDFLPIKGMRVLISGLIHAKNATLQRKLAYQEMKWYFYLQPWFSILR